MAWRLFKIQPCRSQSKWLISILVWRDLWKWWFRSYQSLGRENTQLSGYDHGFYSINFPEYWYEILYLRNVRIIPLQEQGNPKDTMDVNVSENSRRCQESQRRVAEHISYLLGEGTVFVQESTDQYLPSNFIYVLKSQWHERGRLE